MAAGRAHWWETVALFVALLSIWPWFLKWPNPFWRIFAYVMLGVMVMLVVIRFRRLRKLRTGD